MHELWDHKWIRVKGIQEDQSVDVIEVVEGLWGLWTKVGWGLVVRNPT